MRTALRDSRAAVGCSARIRSKSLKVRPASPMVPARKKLRREMPSQQDVCFLPQMLNTGIPSQTVLINRPTVITAAGGHGKWTFSQKLATELSLPQRIAAGSRWCPHSRGEPVPSVGKQVLEGDMEFEIAGKVEHPRAGEELLIRPSPCTRRETSARPRPLAVRLQAWWLTLG